MDTQTVTPLEPSPAARMMTFFRRHKVALTAIASSAVTATVLTKMGTGAQTQMIEFITDKGLLDEYIQKYPLIVKE